MSLIEKIKSIDLKGLKEKINAYKTNITEKTSDSFELAKEVIPDTVNGVTNGINWGSFEVKADNKQLYIIVGLIGVLFLFFGLNKSKSVNSIKKFRYKFRRKNVKKGYNNKFKKSWS